jgi:deoxycytidylate deaminase
MSCPSQSSWLDHPNDQVTPNGHKTVGRSHILHITAHPCLIMLASFLEHGIPNIRYQATRKTCLSNYRHFHISKPDSTANVHAKCKQSARKVYVF